MVVILSSPGTSALVLDSPHSGTDYPPDFDFSCDAALLRQAEHTHAEKPYAFASDADAGDAWIESLFTRSCLDLNRGLDEIDVRMAEPPWPKPSSDDPRVRSKLRLGKELIWRRIDKGVDIHRRPLRIEEGERRIANCRRPHHAAVPAAVDAAHARYGYSIHANCHSMSAVVSPSTLALNDGFEPLRAHLRQLGDGLTALKPQAWLAKRAVP